MSVKGLNILGVFEDTVCILLRARDVLLRVQIHINFFQCLCNIITWMHVLFLKHLLFQEVMQIAFFENEAGDVFYLLRGLILAMIKLKLFLFLLCFHHLEPFWGIWCSEYFIYWSTSDFATIWIIVTLKNVGRRN